MDWARAFVLPLYTVQDTAKPNPERALLLTKLDMLTTNITDLQAKFATGGIAADLLAGALELAAEEKDRLQKQIAALPPDQAPPNRLWHEMSFDEQRQALLYMVSKITVHHNRIVVTFQDHQNRQPCMFPLMRSKPAGVFAPPTACLVPDGLTHAEAWQAAVYGDDGEAVINWCDHVNDQRGNRGYKGKPLFFYADPELAATLPIPPECWQLAQHRYQTGDGQTIVCGHAVYDALKCEHARLNRRPTLAECQAVASRLGLAVDTAKPLLTLAENDADGTVWLAEANAATSTEAPEAVPA